MTGTDRKGEMLDVEDTLLSELYRATATQMPTKTLDDSILAASRKAVRSQPRAAGPFNRRWPARLAVAATLVVAIILLPDLFRQSPKQVDLPVLSPAFDMAPALDTAPTFDAASESAVSGPSHATISEQEMRVQDQVNRKQSMVGPQQATSERRKSAPRKRYSLKTAPMAGTTKPLLRPETRQSLGSVVPAAPRYLRQDSALTRSRSAAQLPRPEPGAISPMVSQGARASRAPAATIPEKNTLLNRQIRLKAIRQLIKAGKIKSARELARQFIKTYPDDPLPKDLGFLVLR